VFARQIIYIFLSLLVYSVHVGYLANYVYYLFNKTWVLGQMPVFDLYDYIAQHCSILLAIIIGIRTNKAKWGGLGL